MTKQTIEVEGLPEGWKAVAYRLPKQGDYYLRYGKCVFAHDDAFIIEYLIVEKIKLRRIVLEETDEKYLGNQVLDIDGTHISIMTARKWREVKETDIPLTKEDDKLSLSVDECKVLLSGSWTPINKIRKFIKDK